MLTLYMYPVDLGSSQIIYLLYNKQAEISRHIIQNVDMV